MNCNVNNTGYRWICRTCIYKGETSRSIRIRSQEHLKVYQSKKTNSLMYKHQILEHKSEENIKFELEIIGKFKDALTRQANKSVRI